MNHADGPRSPGYVQGFFRQASDIPDRLESSLRSRPLATTTAIAGVAFLAGTIAGSRVARAVVAAAAPVLARRLLDGPLGDDLVAYVKRAIGVPVSDSGSNAPS